MKILIIFISLCFSSVVFGQDIRLAYYNNDKYAIVDENMVEILPPIFDKVVISIKHKVLVLNKNGFWGIYSFNGEKILDHIIPNKRRGNQSPLILNTTKNQLQKSGRKDTFSCGLLTIEDQKTKTVYYINPNYVLPSYKAYSNKVKLHRKYDYTGFNKGHEIFNVLTLDNKTNFIDSTGQEILKTGILDGFFLRNDLYAISDGNKFALFLKNKRLTGFDFHHVKVINSNGLIQCIKKNIAKDGERLKYPSYAKIYSPKGKLLIDSIYVASANESSIIANKKIGPFQEIFSLYSNEGDFIFSKDSVHGDFINFETHSYIRTKNAKYRLNLLDLKGNKLLQDGYSIIEKDYPNNCVSTRINETCSVLDSNLNTIFEMKRIVSLGKIPNKDLFKYKVKSGKNYFFGISNINKEEVEKPIWNDMKIMPCNDLILVKNDSFQIIKNIGSNNDIIKTSITNKLTCDCYSKIIKLKTKTSKISYDLNGNFIKEDVYSKVKPQSKYSIKKDQKSMELVDSTGRNVVMDRFKNITSFYDFHSKGSIYFATKFNDNNRNEPVVSIYNDNLKLIAPPGYSMPDKWIFKAKQNPGTLLFANIEDIKKNRNYFKIGLSNFKEDWLIQPFFGNIVDTEKGLFIFRDYTTLKYLFYSSAGKLISDKYDYLLKGNGSDFFQNRILIGNFEDDQYLKKINEIRNKKLSPKETLDKINEIQIPSIKYGYLDLTGKLVIPQIYSDAKPFKMRSDRATVSLLKNGKQFCQIINSAGQVLVEGPFDEIDYLGDEYYKVKKEGKWAILDGSSNLKTPFKFDLLTKDNKELRFNGSDKKDSYIITETFEIYKLAEDYGRFNMKKINDQYSYVTTKTKIDIYLFTGEKVATFSDVKNVSASFNGEVLPNGYLCLNFRANKKPIIYDIKKKTRLEDL